MTDGPHLDRARRALDGNLSAPTKLTVMAVLVRLDDIEFGALRDATGLSDSVLSRQLSALDGIGYLALRKGYVGKRPRTWARATDLGRQAFASHVAALTALIGPR